MVAGLRLSFLPFPAANPSIVFFCHTFCNLSHCSPLSILVPLHYTAVANKLPIRTKQKVATLQPPPPFRLCQKKNNPKLFIITASYGNTICALLFHFRAPMFLFIRYIVSHKSIMINSLCSQPAWEAVSSWNRFTQKSVKWKKKDKSLQ